METLPTPLIQLQNHLAEARQRGTLFLQRGDMAQARAPSNIALIKYWGKEPNHRGEFVQRALNPSISLTLPGFTTHTRITIQSNWDNLEETLPHGIAFHGTTDFFTPGIATQHRTQTSPKLTEFLDGLLDPWGKGLSLWVDTHNTFPTGCGVASSASGYAALVKAVANLLRLERFFNKDECQYWIMQWSRLGSGSAIRSCFPDHVGWIKWEGELAHALDVHPTFHALKHALVIVDGMEKNISSSQGHRLVNTSPFQSIRLANVKQEVVEFEHHLKSGDFKSVQFLAEKDAFSMHAVMTTSNPPIVYLQPKTLEVLEYFLKLRNQEGAEALWTLDAGPNIHILYTVKAMGFMEKFTQYLNEKKITVRSDGL